MAAPRGIDRQGALATVIACALYFRGISLEHTPRSRAGARIHPVAVLDILPFVQGHRLGKYRSGRLTATVVVMALHCAQACGSEEACFSATSRRE